MSEVSRLRYSSILGRELPVNDEIAQDNGMVLYKSNRCRIKWNNVRFKKRLRYLNSLPNKSAGNLREIRKIEGYGPIEICDEIFFKIISYLTLPDLKNTREVCIMWRYYTDEECIKNRRIHLLFFNLIFKKRFEYTFNFPFLLEGLFFDFNAQIRVSRTFKRLFPRNFRRIKRALFDCNFIETSLGVKLTDQAFYDTAFHITNRHFLDQLVSSILKSQMFEIHKTTDRYRDKRRLQDLKTVTEYRDKKGVNDLLEKELEITDYNINQVRQKKINEFQEKALKETLILISIAFSVCLLASLAMSLLSNIFGASLGVICNFAILPKIRFSYKVFKIIASLSSAFLTTVIPSLIISIGTIIFTFYALCKNSDLSNKKVFICISTILSSLMGSFLGVFGTYFLSFHLSNKVSKVALRVLAFLSFNLLIPAAYAISNTVFFTISILLNSLVFGAFRRLRYNNESPLRQEIISKEEIRQLKEDKEDELRELDRRKHIIDFKIKVNEITRSSSDERTRMIELEDKFSSLFCYVSYLKEYLERYIEEMRVSVMENRIIRIDIDKDLKDLINSLRNLKDLESRRFKIEELGLNELLQNLKDLVMLHPINFKRIFNIPIENALRKLSGLINNIEYLKKYYFKPPVVRQIDKYFYELRRLISIILEKKSRLPLEKIKDLIHIRNELIGVFLKISNILKINICNLLTSNPWKLVAPLPNTRVWRLNKGILSSINRLSFNIHVPGSLKFKIKMEELLTEREEIDKDVEEGYDNPREIVIEEIEEEGEMDY